MKRKKLLTCIITAVMGLTMTSFVSANADTKSNYTVTDLRNLQDFLLAKETSDLSGKNYDLNGDGRWDVFDMCLMRQEYLKHYNEDDEPKNLVAYYSASGTTEKVADYIAEAVNADVFVITPVDEYTDEDLDWTDSNSRVVYEHNNPDTTHVELIQTVPDNFETYDNVFIGYPIWWQEAAWVVDDFVTENDFTGKNVIPFCTSMSSPLGDSGKLLAEMSGTGNWFEGMRFTSRSDKETVQNWAKNLDLDKHSSELVVYFTYSENIGDTSGIEADAVSSASLNQQTNNKEGNLKIMAQEIAKLTGSDIYSIRKTTPYAFNYSDMLETALLEQSNNTEIELNLSDIPDLFSYDTIYLGTPVWAGSLPQPMVTFLRNNNLSGKKIVVFGIHLGSGFGRNINQIKELCPDSEVVEGITVNATTANENTRVKIQEWLN